MEDKTRKRSVLSQYGKSGKVFPSLGREIPILAMEPLNITAAQRQRVETTKRDR